MKRAQRRRPAAHGPIVTVQKTLWDDPDRSHNRVFTPKIFLAPETEIKCVSETPDKGSVTVLISEDDWEHRRVFLNIAIRNQGDSVPVDELAGFIPPARLDQIIEALTLVRDKAKSEGMLAFRQIPHRVKWIRDPSP